MSWAVILGDIVGSTRFSDKREIVLDALNDSFDAISTHIDGIGDTKRIDFEIYRGDSFQGIIYRPEHALKAALFIRASLRSLKDPGPDCRIAIGIGNIEYRADQRVGLLDGEAFHAAAKGMEGLKSGSAHLAIKISDPSMHNFSQEFATECILADAIIRDWKETEAEAVKFSFLCKTQSEIAKKIGITQGAVSQRLVKAKFAAIESFLTRYQEIAKNNFRNSELLNEYE